MKLSKKNFTVYGVVLLFVAVFALGAIIITGLAAPAAVPEVLSLSSTSEKEKPQTYLVKEYEGKLAVFNTDNLTVPQKIYDEDLTVLPSYDQILLLDGILVYSDEELRKVIEDYTS